MMTQWRTQRGVSWILSRKAIRLVFLISAAVMLGYLLKFFSPNSPVEGGALNPRNLEVVIFPERIKSTLHNVWRSSSKPTAIVVYLPSCSSGCGTSMVAKLDVFSRHFDNQCQIIILFGNGVDEHTMQRLSTTLKEWKSTVIVTNVPSLSFPEQFGVILGAKDQHIVSAFQEVVSMPLMWQGG
ncbi:MAG: hypothetical protein QXS54_10680 [Candidatus Methanomethylicaceae archaeon]